MRTFSFFGCILALASSRHLFHEGWIARPAKKTKKSSQPCLSPCRDVTDVLTFSYELRFQWYELWMLSELRHLQKKQHVYKLYKLQRRRRTCQILYSNLVRLLVDRYCGTHRHSWRKMEGTNRRDLAKSENDIAQLEYALEVDFKPMMST